MYQQQNDGLRKAGDAHWFKPVEGLAQVAHTERHRVVGTPPVSQPPHLLHTSPQHCVCHSWHDLIVRRSTHAIASTFEISVVVVDCFAKDFNMHACLLTFAFKVLQECAAFKKTFNMHAPVVTFVFKVLHEWTAFMQTLNTHARVIAFFAKFSRSGLFW